MKTFCEDLKNTSDASRSHKVLFKDLDMLEFLINSNGIIKRSEKGERENLQVHKGQIRHNPQIGIIVNS